MIVTVSSKGQVVIPAPIRQRLGIVPGSSLEILEQPDGTLLVSVRRAVAVTTIDEGYGMLRYSGPPRSLADFDAARAMRGDYDP